MQLSNRLTFSLASLILIFALAFVAMPAMAAEGGPTVDIGQGTSKARATFDLTFSFSDPVEAAGSTGGSLAFTWRLADAQTNLLGTATTGSATQTAGSRTDYTAQIDITVDTNNVSAVKVIVSVAADIKTGTTTANDKQNQAGQMTFDLLPVQGDTTVTVTAEEATPKMAGKYTVTFTFSANANPAFAEANIAIPTTGVALSNFQTVTAETVYSVDAQLEFGASNIMVGVDPGYAKPASAGKNMVTLPPPPPADPVYQNPPAVTLSVTNHNAAERTFQVSVSTTPAANTEGGKGTDIAGSAIKTHLMVKDGSTPAVDVGVNRLDDDPANERISANSYRAILEYGPFDTLPLTVSIDPDALATPADPAATGVDPVTDMVGTAAPVGTDDDPSVAITVSNYNAATRQFRVQVTITPGMKADGSAGDPITAFGLSNLKITDAGDAAVMITTVDERFTAGTAASRAGMYVAILQYNPLAVLPLTITTVDGFMSSDDPKTTAMVPPGGTTTPPPANAPAKPAAPTATINTANDLIIDVSWTAPADNGSAITGYTVKKYGADGALVKTFPDDDPNTATITTTSYSIGPVPAADRGESFTLTVTAMNANGSGPESDMSAAVMIPAAPTSGGNTAPKFDDPAPPGLTWCEGEEKGLTMIRLPRASDNEGDELTYSLSPALPENPSSVPGEGLYWVTVDQENRYLRGKATLADAGTYTWKVTDDGSPSMSADIKFTIVVKPAVKPAKPTSVMAMKLNSAATDPKDPEYNRVSLTWVDGNPTSYPNDGCIPEVIAYIVTRTPWVNGELDTTNTVTETLTKADDADELHYDLSDPMAVKYMTENALELGTYIFTVQAVSDHPIAAKADLKSDASDRAIWDKTGHNLVIVANPPVAPTDLRATVNEDDKVTVNWIAPAENSAAPVDDSDSADRMKIYGVDKGFGGYVVYRIKDGDTVRYPEDEGEVLNGAEVVYETEELDEGEYSFRVTAVNIAGESMRSISTPFSTITIVGDDQPPVTTPDPTDPVTPDPSDPSLPAGTNVITGTYNTATNQTVLRGTLASKGFGVLQARGLPDLQRFLLQRGSITLYSTNTAIEANDVVISEIMWGLNLSAPTVAARDDHQWIELYNATGSPINLSTFTLDFKQSFDLPTDDNKVDQFSNVYLAGWVVDQGQNGSLNPGVNVAATNLISMYRNIDYVKVEANLTTNRGERNKGIPNGRSKGSWKGSNVADIYAANRIGSPGKKHILIGGDYGATSVPRSPIIITEVGNLNGESHDWIELTAIANVNLEKYELQYVKSDKTIVVLAQFVKKQLNAGEILLVLGTHPSNANHPVAAGKEWKLAVADQVKPNASSLYHVDSRMKLPDTIGKATFILRKEKGKTNHEHIVDLAGNLFIADSGAAYRTALWPLRATSAGHGNVIDGGVEDFNAPRAYQRNDRGGGIGEKDWNVRGFTGVGYDRMASGANAPGTPGFDNSFVRDKSSSLTGGNVSISEIMYERVGNAPQWIELYNSSKTEGVNLNEWKLRIENSSDDTDVDVRFRPTIQFGTVHIPPNETVLIVSARSGQNSGNFPAHRVIDLWANTAQRNELEVANVGRNYQLLSTKSFKLTLIEKGGAVVDTVGNLEMDWELPASEAGTRSSIIREYTSRVKSTGTMAETWVHASISSLTHSPIDLYYGRRDDMGTPGFRGGGPLPVSLSKFRPERLDDGTIVVRWITESELDNAGFNILRGETKDGEFTKLNEQLIAGKGTTSEKNSYEFVDTSAKPNVVYYYQIQDVSLDGDVVTLRTTRLKGHVSPAGKATTTWGELKALQ